MALSSFKPTFKRETIALIVIVFLFILDE